MKESTTASTLPPSYFHQIYAAKGDPWAFATSDYEAGKYQRTVAALTRDCYANAFEIGCSIGVLTALLAVRCGHLLSVDLSEVALEQARRRCGALSNVEFRLLTVPDEYPTDLFDLTVLSEVGYYLGFEDLKKLALLIQQHTARNGHLLLVHWLGHVAEDTLTGNQVHDYFLSLPHWYCLTQYTAPQYTAPQYQIELLQLRGRPRRDSNRNFRQPKDRTAPGP